MKKVFAVAALVAALVGANRANVYTSRGTVYKVENDIVKVIEFNTGEAWEFRGTGFCKGDELTLKFSDNGTLESREDDKLVKAWKE